MGVPLGDSLGVVPTERDAVGEAEKLGVDVGDCVEELVLVRVPDCVAVPDIVAEGVPVVDDEPVIDIVPVSLIVVVPDGVSEGEVPSESDDVGVGVVLPVFVIEPVGVLLAVLDGDAVGVIDFVPDKVEEPVGDVEDVAEDVRDEEGVIVAVSLELAPKERDAERDAATV